METVFWQRFKALCDEESLTPNAVMAKCGLNNGNPTAWKNGRKPGAATLEVLAGYFVCPIDYLAGKSDQRYYPWDERYMSETENAPGSEPEAIRDEDLKFAMFGTTEITDELLAELRTYANYLKERKL